MNITRVGIDLAKTVFQVHGVDEKGKTMLRKQLKRAQLLEFFANLQRCLIGMEACASAHYWARKLTALGHEVKLIAPQLVKPYVKSNKNDRNDAEAICEALGRPNMRFVPVKSPDQQALLALHRVREGLVAARTAQVNQIRGLLAEFGLVMPQGVAKMRTRVPQILEDGANELPGLMRELLARCYEQFQQLDAQAHELEARIVRWHRDNEASQRLAKVPGVGPITASAYVATVGDGQAFKSGRHAAAWLGIVPRQHGTGGKQQLLGISKRGDVYLRKLLIHGARAVLRHLKPEADSWLGQLAKRRHRNVAAVALANKNARIMWALLAHGREYNAYPAGLSRARGQVALLILRIKAFFGLSSNAVKTQIWIAVAVYVLVAIIKKRLNLPASLYELLQILSLTMFETTPLHQLLSPQPNDVDMLNATKQLTLFDF